MVELLEGKIPVKNRTTGKASLLPEGPDRRVMY
jgi:hypothetical protein